MAGMINTCPNCGSKRVSCRKKWGCVFWIFVLISMGLALIMIPFMPSYCKCIDCGAEWKS